jgi:prophage maintenance system killer protein
MAALGRPPSGLRDVVALERALLRPRLWAQFGDGDLFEQAALLGVALIQEHPFWEENASTAVLAVVFFLERNRAPTPVAPDRLLSLLAEAATAPDAERDAAVRGVAGRLRGDHAER